MIANSANPYPGAVPHPFTLNDLRVHNTVAEAPSSTSALTLSGLALAVLLAIGAFIWLDPLHLLAPTEAGTPAPAFVPSAEPARPTAIHEIIAPLTPVPATKSVEAPVPPAPVTVREPQVAAPVVRPPAVRPHAASIKPMAPPALLTKPEEKTDAPIVPKLGDDTRNAPQPAAANDPTPVTD